MVVTFQCVLLTKRAPSTLHEVDSDVGDVLGMGCGNVRKGVEERCGQETLTVCTNGIFKRKDDILLWSVATMFSSIMLQVQRESGRARTELNC